MNNNVKKRWTPVLETLGVDSSHKRFDQLCEYAEIQKNLLKANESVNFANQYNSRGFGDVTFPGVNSTPGKVGSAGSGDIGQTMLPASVKIAAHTPGLNLLPVINVDSNRVDMLYYDWKYDDYQTFDGDTQQERGTTFKLPMSKSNIDDIKNQLKAMGVGIRRGMLDKEVFVSLDLPIANGLPVATISDWSVKPIGNKYGVVQFKGFSYIDGFPMFRIFTQDNSASTGGWGFKQELNTLPQDGSISSYFQSGAELDFGGVVIEIEDDATALEVSLNEDVIDDFTSNRSKDPMPRGEWDVTTAGKIGPESFVKSVQIGVRHVSATLRLSELNDFRRMHGVDIVAKTREQLINLIQQEISIEIVEKVKEMGEKNRSQAISLSSTGESIFDMDISKYTTGTGLYENTFSLTRKLWQKVKSGAFFIKSDGRWGAADYAIVSGTMASQLAEMKGYNQLPINNHSLNLGQSIDAVGTLDGLTIYIDPYMMPGDNNIYLGRVGGNEDPGLKFFAYMLAEQVEIVSERTMAPHLYLYSRYAISEYGFFPEKQYLAIHVHDNGNPADVLW